MPAVMCQPLFMGITERSPTTSQAHTPTFSLAVGTDMDKKWRRWRRRKKGRLPCVNQAAGVSTDVVVDGVFVFLLLHTRPTPQPIIKILLWGGVRGSSDFAVCWRTSTPLNIPRQSRFGFIGWPSQKIIKNKEPLFLFFFFVRL